MVKYLAPEALPGTATLSPSSSEESLNIWYVKMLCRVLVNALWENRKRGRICSFLGMKPNIFEIQIHFYLFLSKDNLKSRQTTQRKGKWNVFPAFVLHSADAKIRTLLPLVTCPRLPIFYIINARLS